MDEEVKITIEGGGLSLVRFTTLHKAGQIISFLGMEQAEHQSPQATQFALTERKRQAKDLIVESGAKTYPQKIVALAKYIHDQMGQETFTPQEVRSLFKKMGDEPKNFTRDLKEALERQYIVCVDSSSDLYSITDKGEEAIQGGFNTNHKKSVSIKRTPATFRGTRDEVKNLEITGSLEGYPDFHSLPAKADKILWLLAYADLHGIKGLSSAEVDFLSTNLRDRVASKHFSTFNQRNEKKSYVIKVPEGFLLHKKGSSYLKELS